MTVRHKPPATVSGCSRYDNWPACRDSLRQFRRLAAGRPTTALRHADINITTQHYIRNTKRIAPELGHLLKGAENVVELPKGMKAAETSNRANVER